MGRLSCSSLFRESNFKDVTVIDAVLHVAWQVADRGIWVVNSVYNWGGASADSAANPVNAVKDHPAILMWSTFDPWSTNLAGAIGE